MVGGPQIGCPRRLLQFRHVEQGWPCRREMDRKGAADSSSDSNAEESQRPAATGCAGSAEVTDACERL
jgi:hypothetical protein